MHSAEVADHAADAGFALYLAGHTHGGQICLPGGRVLISHMVRLREYASGRWRCRNMQGYTSTGVGVSSLPVRFNTRGEIAVITLATAEHELRSILAPSPRIAGRGLGLTGNQRAVRGELPGALHHLGLGFRAPFERVAGEHLLRIGGELRPA